MTENCNTVCISAMSNILPVEIKEIQKIKLAKLSNFSVTKHEELKKHFDSLFGVLEQKITEKASLEEYEGIVDQLIEDEFLNVEDQELNVLTALCLSDAIVLKRTQVTEFLGDKKADVFQLFIKCLTHLEEDLPSDRIVCLLEHLSTNKLFTYFTDLPDLDKLFTLFFKVLGPNHSSEIVIFILDILVALLTQCKTKYSNVPDSIIRVLLINLHPMNDASNSKVDGTQDSEKSVTTYSPSASAQLLAQQILYKTVDLIASNVNSYLSSILSDLDDCLDCEWSNFHDVLYKLFSISPSLVDLSLPLLENFLTKTDVHLRKKTVNVLGCIFATPEVGADTRYYHLFNLFLKRFKDQESSIRVIMTEFVEAYVSNAESSSNNEAVLAGLKDRLQDLDETVRHRAIKVVISLVKSDSATKITSDVWQECLSRVRDKKPFVRRETITGISQIYLNKNDIEKTDYLNFSKIPQTILSLYAVEPELVEQVLFEMLTSSKTKITPSNMVKKWINFVTSLDDTGRGCMTKIFQDKVLLRSEVQRWTAASEQKNVKAIEKSLTIISSLINPSAPTAYFEKLKQLDSIENKNLKNFFNILASPLSSSESVNKALQQIDAILKNSKSLKRRNINQLVYLIVQKFGISKLDLSFAGLLPETLFELVTETDDDQDSSQEEENFKTKKKNDIRPSSAKSKKPANSKSSSGKISANNKKSKNVTLSNSPQSNASNEDLITQLEGSRKEQISSVLFLIEILLPCFTHYFKNSIPVLAKLLLLKKPDIIDVTLNAIFHLVSHFSNQIAKMENVKTEFVNLVFHGTPKQAKYAAKIFLELHKNDKLSLARTVKLLVQNATSPVNTNGAAIFSSLIEFSSLLLVKQIESLFEYVIGDLLKKTWVFPPLKKSKKNQNSEQCSLVQTQVEAIYFLTRCFVNQLSRPSPESGSTSKNCNVADDGPIMPLEKMTDFLENFLKFEFTTLQKCNPKDDQLQHLQGVVISSVLLLAEFKFAESKISIANLQTIANLASTGSKVFKSTLRSCLYNGLSTLKKLPLKYLALYPFVVERGVSTSKSQFEEVVMLRRRFMREKAQNYFTNAKPNAVIRSVLPEYSLPWFVYLLSHMPGFPESDQPTFINTIAYINTFFTAIMQHNEHYDFIMQFLADMKQTQDAQNPESHDIHIVVDLCSVVFKKRMTTNLKTSIDSAVDSNLVEVILPRDLFRVPIVDGKPSLLPINVSYLPQNLNLFDTNNFKKRSNSLNVSATRKKKLIENEYSNSCESESDSEGKLVNFSKLKN